MKIVKNPVATCDEVYALIQSLTSQIRKRMEDPKSAGELRPQHAFSSLNKNANILLLELRVPERCSES